jgi:hypothetical protein
MKVPRCAAFVLLFLTVLTATAQPVEPVLTQARAQKAPLLETLKDLVSIESGSRDFEGLEKIGGLIAERLRSLGGELERLEASEVYKMEDTPERIGRMVRAFAALKTRNAVVERFGLRGFGAHSTDDEYVLVLSIEPRLYLAARLIMDLSRDRIR